MDPLDLSSLPIFFSEIFHRKDDSYGCLVGTLHVRTDRRPDHELDLNCVLYRETLTTSKVHLKSVILFEESPLYT